MSNGKTLHQNGHEVPLSQYRSVLKDWGREHLRKFPWRETRDPYRLLMAEFMLIRTQASQVEPVYRKFMSRYPSLEDLAEASREDIHCILRPLGLSWRADRLFETVRKLEKDHDLTVPTDRNDLLDLPGVSQYIAGAVRCFALEEPEALIDTNTVRVTARLFGLEIKDSSRRTSRFRQLIGELVDPDRPRLYNLSILDLGSKVCTSKKPSCHNCPLSEMCVVGQSRSKSG